MPTVTISETYDLSTKVNKMSLVAIHTPKKEIIQRLYPGLCMNYKYCHIDGIDVALASASVLPASPDQLGLDVDDIAPQDMFNPILYKAVSNDSFSTLEARIQMIARGATDPAVLTSGQMADIAKDDVTGQTDDFGVYYSLLSTPDGFKTAHPQRGLAMRNLVPLVFEKYYNIGENANAIQNVGSVPALGAGSGTSGSRPITVQNATVYEMRGRPHRMPRFNTTYITVPVGSDVNTAASGSGTRDSGMVDAPLNTQVNMATILPVMCGVILLPPAKRTLMFYRLHVRVRISFSEVRPITDVASFSGMASAIAPVAYHTDYADQSKDMDKSTDLVDVKDADLEKIMEGI